MQRRRAIQIVIGATALVGAATIGVVALGGGDTGPPATTSTTAAPTSAPVPDDLIEAFFDDWATAATESDIEFLVRSLHPDIIDLYGAEQCVAYFHDVLGPPVAVDVISLSTPADEPLDLDGDGRIVSDVIRARIERSDIGGEMTVRVVVDGPRVRWFSDCGDPDRKDAPTSTRPAEDADAPDPE